MTEEDAARRFRALDVAVRDGDRNALARLGKEMSSWAPEWWAALDRYGRGSWDTWHVADRRAAGRAAVARENAVAGLVAWGVSGNGYAREAAVERLADSAHPAAVRLLALRTTDSVVDVARLARDVVERRVRDGDVAAFAGACDVAGVVWRRYNGEWLSELVADVVRDGDEALLDVALACPAPLTRRLAYVHAADRLPLPRFVSAALRDPDLSVRVRCVEAAVRAAAGDPDALRPLVRSRTARVRAAVLDALARAGSTREALDALGDRSPAVRAVAQAVARRVGADPAAYYRVAAPTATAAAGLGETGDVSDAPLLRERLTDERTSVRRAAVRALRRVGGADAATLAPLLRDPSAAVTSAVAAALRPYAARVDAVPLLDPAQPPHVRHAAYSVLRVRDHATRLRTDLALLDDPDLGPLALGDLREWLRRDAVRAYVVADAPLAAAVARAERRLSDGELRELRFTLRIR